MTPLLRRARRRTVVLAVARAAVACAAVACTVLFPTVAAAEALEARDTAQVGPKGAASIGVFNPLRIAVRDQIEIQTHPALFFIAPNVLVRVAHLDLADQLRITGEYGLSIPTLAMRLAQGYLFPTWHHDQQRIGWLAAPRAGIVVSTGRRQSHVITARVDLTVGIPLSHTDTTPLDTYAPLELLFAPVTAGYRARVGALYDRSVSQRWRLRGYTDIYLHGSGELHDPGDWPLASSPRVTTRLGVAADVALGISGRNRLTFGMAWWNYFQHAIDPITFESRRSNDVWPTADFIWAH